MTYFEDIENYLKNLATKHKQLLHGNGGVAFIQMGIADEVTTVNGRKKVYMKIMDVSSSIQNEYMIWTVSMVFLKELPAMRTNADIDAASKLTQEIMYDFEARIREQYNDECYFVKRLQPPTLEPVGLTDNSAIGWMYTWRFSTDQPDYDINAWEE
jgi:hypothetical protein